MAMTERPHLFPSRTQKLSSPVSMVLGPKGPGRVDRRQVNKNNSLSCYFSLQTNTVSARNGNRVFSWDIVVFEVIYED